MNKTIMVLEAIGQTVSVKQFDDLSEMISETGLASELDASITDIDLDYVCAIRAHEMPNIK